MYVKVNVLNNRSVRPQRLPPKREGRLFLRKKPIKPPKKTSIEKPNVIVPIEWIVSLILLVINILLKLLELLLQKFE